jgi:hypothetical protein
MATKPVRDLEKILWGREWLPGPPWAPVFHPSHEIALQQSTKE